ncbi:hypothetical protein [Clostridium saccharoperbutylacetonicum]|nr:hypothetical protein [Clostridium saccharoperbutylacetonicum]
MTELEDIDLREWIEKETGQKFNRENKICCPFHNEKNAFIWDQVLSR